MWRCVNGCVKRGGPPFAKEAHTFCCPIPSEVLQLPTPNEPVGQRQQFWEGRGACSQDTICFIFIDACLRCQTDGKQEECVGKLEADKVYTCTSIGFASKLIVSQLHKSAMAWMLYNMH